MMQPPKSYSCSSSTVKTGVASILRTGLETILSRRDCRTEPGVLTPGIRAKMIRPHKAVLQKCLVRKAPRDREMQFEPGAVLRYSSTTSLRVASFDDEDEDEPEYD
jgi:hypothetical protein